MCLASDKIKFCTCTASSVEQLKHYWVLHRRIKGKNAMVIGEPVMPYDLSREENQVNEQLLLRRINEPDAFDVDLKPADGDRLQVSFKCVEVADSYVHYGFSYSNGKSKKAKYDGLKWMWHHEETRFGKLQNALRRGDTR